MSRTVVITGAGGGLDEQRGVEISQDAKPCGIVGECHRQPHTRANPPKARMNAPFLS